MRLIARLLLFVCSLSLGLLLLEAGLRLTLTGSLRNPAPSSGLTQAHPTRGWVLTPGARGLRSDIDYRIDVQVSSQGLRDVEHALEAEPGVFRVVLLGDSFVEAYQVELAESLPRQLEAQLSDARLEVINLGVGGYGSTQESLALEEEGLRFSPDLVVLAFFAGNDVRNNSQLLETRLWQGRGLKSFGRPFARLQGEKLSVSSPSFGRASAWIEAKRAQDRDRPLREHLLCWDLGRSLLARLGHALGTRVHDYDPNLVLGVYARGFDPESALDPLTPEQYAREWQQAWRVTEAVLLRTRRVASENGAAFVLLSIPSKFQADPEYREQVMRSFPRMQLDPTLPNLRLRAFATENGIPLLDLQEALAAHYEAGHPPLYHSFRDRHWNAEGHRVAAELLADFLQEQGLVKASAR